MKAKHRKKASGADATDKDAPESKGEQRSGSRRPTPAGRTEKPGDHVRPDTRPRKQAEAERQKFVSLADQSTEFIGMCDMEFRPFYANDAALQIVGLDSLEEACRTPVQEFFFPEDQTFIVNEFFPKVLREGRAEVEIRFRHFKTGKAVWMIHNVFFVKGVDGKPVGLATVSRNITERKRAEEALRESEERYRILFASAPMAVFVCDRNAVIQHYNQRAVELWGREPACGVEQHCGSVKLWLPNGALLPLARVRWWKRCAPAPPRSTWKCSLSGPTVRACPCWSTLPR